MILLTSLSTTNCMQCTACRMKAATAFMATLIYDGRRSKLKLATRAKRSLETALTSGQLVSVCCALFCLSLGTCPTTGYLALAAQGKWIQIDHNLFWLVALDVSNDMLRVVFFAIRKAILILALPKPGTAIPTNFNKKITYGLFHRGCIYID